MAEKSLIEWTDATWNPITGCSVVSPGCTNCYAMRLAGTRLRQHPSRAGLTRESKAGPVWNGTLRLNENWLTQPLAWRRPRRIFVCAHGDLFHEAVPDAWIDRVFAVMALAPWHTFQVLTKRSERMRSYLSMARAHPVGMAAFEQTMRSMATDPGLDVGKGVMLKGDIPHLKVWPLPNVWLGVSAEDQRRADERVLDLLQTPAALRFMSAEPLLGPIKLTALNIRPNRYLDAFRCDYHDGSGNILAGPRSGTGPIDWLIVGGESGPGARPTHPDWVRSLRDQCAAAGVPFHFKQWGMWHPCTWSAEDPWYPMPGHEPFDSWAAPVFDQQNHDGWNWRRLGKRAAGRLLDGVEHNGMPSTFR